MQIKENDQNTYSNSYKKLMILRELNPIEQNRGQNEWNSWNPMKMINPTHFFLKKCVESMESGDFPLSGTWNGRIGPDLIRTEPNSTERTEPNSAQLNLKRTESNSTQQNWNELDRIQVNWTETNWAWQNSTEPGTNWNELNSTELKRTEPESTELNVN